MCDKPRLSSCCCSWSSSCSSPCSSSSLLTLQLLLLPIRCSSCSSPYCPSPLAPPACLLLPPPPSTHADRARPLRRAGLADPPDGPRRLGGACCQQGPARPGRRAVRPNSCESPCNQANDIISTTVARWTKVACIHWPKSSLLCFSSGGRHFSLSLHSSAGSKRE